MRRLSVVLLATSFTPAAFAQTLPAEEQAVCSAEMKGVEQGPTLLKEWNELKSADANNAAQKELKLRKISQQADTLLSNIRGQVYRSTGLQTGRMNGWILIVDKVDISKANGKDNELVDEYIVHTHLPCMPASTIEASVKNPDVKFLQVLSVLTPGTSVNVSGKFMSIDAAMNRPQDARQWAGPMWAPFFGARDAVFTAPEMHVEIGSVK